jgi:hypothetical protein
MPLPFVPVIAALYAGGSLVPHAAGGLIVTAASGGRVGPTTWNAAARAPFEAEAVFAEFSLYTP